MATLNLPNFARSAILTIQEVLPNNDTVVRAYVDSDHWNFNRIYYDIENANLGYEYLLQTRIVQLIKPDIILLLDTTKNKILEYI